MLPKSERRINFPCMSFWQVLKPTSLNSLATGTYGWMLDISWKGYHNRKLLGR